MIIISILGMAFTTVLAVIDHWNIVLLVICILVGMIALTMGLCALFEGKDRELQKSSTDAIPNTESVTETKSIKSNSIKVAILNKYNGAEIISSNEADKGYFIYEQEKYSYELDDNILFINKDNKTVDYLYVN